MIQNLFNNVQTSSNTEVQNILNNNYVSTKSSGYDIPNVQNAVVTKVQSTPTTITRVKTYAPIQTTTIPEYQNEVYSINPQPVNDIITPINTITKTETITVPNVPIDNTPKYQTVSIPTVTTQVIPTTQTLNVSPIQPLTIPAVQTVNTPISQTVSIPGVQSIKYQTTSVTVPSAQPLSLPIVQSTPIPNIQSIQTLQVPRVQTQAVPIRSSLTVPVAQPLVTTNTQSFAIPNIQTTPIGVQNIYRTF